MREKGRDEVREIREGWFFKDLIRYYKYLAICDEWHTKTLKVLNREVVASELSFNRITLKCVKRMWGREEAKTEAKRTIQRLYNIRERGGGNGQEKGSSGRGKTLWFWIKFKIEATVFPTKLSVDKEWEELKTKGFWFGQLEEQSCYKSDGKK